MRILLLLIAASLIQGCATQYHSYYKQGQDSEWDGPFYGGDKSFEEHVKGNCEHSLAFTTPYAVRVHFDHSGGTRTYICSEYPKYQ